MTRLALALCLLLPACAYDGPGFRFAIGNAAVSVCDPRPTPALRAATGDVPVPPPLTPAAVPGCTIVQGGAEAGFAWSTALTALFVILAKVL